ncbi:MAG TPA: hypothetical protein DCG28_02240 [Lachnospiraceae bacterium]|nr:hypothetical protein [Lachnospiraceae bacterium]
MKNILNKIKYEVCAVPYLFFCQIPAWILSALIFDVLKEITYALLIKSGQGVVTSGNYTFLPFNYDGLIIIGMWLLMLMIFVSVDICFKIIVCSEYLKPKGQKFSFMFKRALVVSVKFLSLAGIPVLLYTTIIGPVAGFSYSGTSSDELYIPDFITDFIMAKPFLSAAYLVLIIILIVLGIIHIFTLHCIVLGNQSVYTALKDARKMMLGKRKKAFLLFLKAFFLPVIILVSAEWASILLTKGCVKAASLFTHIDSASWVYVIIHSADIVVRIFILGLYYPLFMLELTKGYYELKEIRIAPEHKRIRHIKLFNGLCAVGGVAAVLLLSLVIHYGAREYLSEDYPKAMVVAHRAGGFADAENTVAGIERSVQDGIDEAEIDVRRTADGYYIIYHDNNFKEHCGVDEKPENLTLEQIKKLRIEGPEGQQREIATMEEILDACKGRIFLNIELKGPSVDEKMYKDIKEMVEKRDMSKQVRYISLNYDIISYIEENYPKEETGFLCYFIYGDPTNIKSDCIMCEEETASNLDEEQIHNAGKKLYVWTVNNEKSMEYFFNLPIDGIITDKPLLAKEKKGILDDTESVDRFIDSFIGDYR